MLGGFWVGHRLFGWLEAFGLVVSFWVAWELVGWLEALWLVGRIWVGWLEALWFVGGWLVCGKRFDDDAMLRLDDDGGFSVGCRLLGWS